MIASPPPVHPPSVRPSARPRRLGDRLTSPQDSVECSECAEWMPRRLGDRLTSPSRASDSGAEEVR